MSTMVSPNVSDQHIHNTEPATGKPMPAVAVASAEQVREVVTRARTAQVRWARLGWAERKKRLLRFRDLLNQRADEVVELISRETGKPRFEALAHEVAPMVDLTHYYATRAEKILADERMWLHLLGPVKRAYVRYVPRGVVGVIAPWNFPFTIPMGDVIMAVAAGNGVVVKPSEWTPHTMLKAKELMDAADVDPDLFGVVPGDGATGAALVESAVDMIIFTGSVATGRKVGAACGQRLIPYIAELGGKDAAIVLDDVDPARVAEQLVHGAFCNSGQACASFERVLIDQKVHDQVLDRIVALTRELRQGDPASREVDIGAMVLDSQMDVVERHIQDAVQKGAKVLAGGKRESGRGRFFQPTVIADVDDTMLCWQEETFGPTMPVRSFTTVDQAVAMANASDYGLNGFVFAGDVTRGEYVARQLQAGGVVVNDFFFHHGVPEAPWGGVKHSGVGRVHGKHGLRELCQQQFVGLPRVALKPFWLFPYTEGNYRMFNRIRRVLSSKMSRFV
ncbi:MAG: aldehyde dehydrogenase family protein [Proteobacteria bacterium]|nr:aldehyde dehydrogenase family protein [Pseudomonadota bacterium]